PTYNRQCSLKELLWGLCTQIKALPEALQADVDVWVNDNASDDTTASCVWRYQQHYPFVNYACNEANLGADRNMHLAISRPEGKFLWLMCDDDIPTHGAILRLLEHIRTLENNALNHEEPQVNLIHTNGYHRNVAMNTILQQRIYMGYQGNALLSGDMFAKTFHNGLLRASTLIFRKSALMGSFLERFHVGYLCAPLVFALQALSQQTPVHSKNESLQKSPKTAYGSYIDEPLITYRENHKPWFDLWPLIAAYYIPLMAFQAEKMGLFPKNTYRHFLVNHAGIARKFFYKMKKFPAKAFSSEPLQERWPISWMTLMRMYAPCRWFWDECIWFCLLPYVVLQWALKHSPIDSHLPTAGVFWLKFQVKLATVLKKKPPQAKPVDILQAVKRLNALGSKVA
ncbi:MAG: glycosyltransferase, partial [Vampirovibrionales bacterium]|nr:glycosyltransferase [Vampirovibrionales bacterium]